MHLRNIRYELAGGLSPPRVSLAQRLHLVYCLYLYEREKASQTVTVGKENLQVFWFVGLRFAGMIFFCHTAGSARRGEAA